mmetsp:Transcript_29237/g.87441  ORF Transcript_29237/g.87441 Transcript_29237/m.87441 type:complete len:292 (-) Transcript_29237:306-1181(-)
MFRAVAVCALTQPALAARAAAGPPARPGRLLMYASTGGLGNQLAGLRSAMTLAAGLNRTLVVPPFLEHGELPYGGGCKTAAGEAELAKRALRLYNFSASQNLVDVLDFSRGVVRFDPNEHARPTLATEYAAARVVEQGAFRRRPLDARQGEARMLLLVIEGGQERALGCSSGAQRFPRRRPPGARAGTPRTSARPRGPRSSRGGSAWSWSARPTSTGRAETVAVGGRSLRTFPGSALFRWRRRSVAWGATAASTCGGRMRARGRSTRCASDLRPRPCTWPARARRRPSARN